MKLARDYECEKLVLNVPASHILLAVFSCVLYRL